MLGSIPQLTPRGEPLHAIPGMVPRPDQFPAGCRFAPRCAYAQDKCSIVPVPIRAPEGGGDAAGALAGTPVSGGTQARCVRQDELVLSGPPPEPMAAATSQGQAGPGGDGSSPGPVLDVTGLVKDFPIRGGVLRRTTGTVRAVDEVSLRVDAGTTLGLVGESGSGKSTLARLVLRLIDPTAGTVVVDGKDITGLRGPALRRHRDTMQLVFQDPYSSLDPRQSIADIVGEPLAIHTSMSRSEREQRVVQLLAQVGLGSHVLPRQPHEFSGGQRQRIAIARSLALRPRLLVCDEPVSALDVSTQSQVINLLTDLQRQLGVAYLFIAHDLSVVRHISKRFAVMYLGQIVEEGDADDVYQRPTHPYTAALPLPSPCQILYASTGARASSCAARSVSPPVKRGGADSGRAAPLPWRCARRSNRTLTRHRPARPSVATCTRPDRRWRAPLSKDWSMRRRPTRTYELRLRSLLTIMHTCVTRPT